MTAAPSPPPLVVASPPATTATPVAERAVRVSGIRLQPPDLAVTLQNVGNAEVDLSGWQLMIGEKSVAVPDGVRLAPAQTVTIRTGTGTNSEREVFLGEEQTARLGEVRPSLPVVLADPMRVAVARSVVPPAAAPEAASAAVPSQSLVDPRDVALSPAELPPGFEIDQDRTSIEVLMVTVAGTVPSATQGATAGNPQPRAAGVRYETELRRAPVGDGFGEGLVVIGQTITRIDEFIDPADILAESRDTLIRDNGFASIQDAAEDELTVYLVKRTANDTIFVVGIVKDDTVVFTSVRGVEPAVDLQFAQDLAARSAAKYDLLAAAPQPAANAESGIHGQVLVRPSCPGIEREDEACAAHPASATITVLTDAGAIVTRVETGPRGEFEIDLPPGHYILRTEVPRAFAPATDQPVVVTEGQTINVSITYHAP